MRTAAEIRAAIAAGEIKRSERGEGKGPGAGIFETKIVSAEFGTGENGNQRGKLVACIVGAEDPANINKKFNVYIQTVDQAYLEESILEYMERCDAWGVEQERIYDRAETGADIVMNMMTELQRKAIKGQLLAVIERKDSGKLNAQGNPNFWNNWLDVSLAGVVREAVAAETPEPEAPVPVPVAPVLAPAAPAKSAAKKPWQK